MKRIVFWFAMLTVPFVFPCISQADSVGTFTYLKGRVDVTRPGQTARPAILGHRVNVGDIVRAKSRSKAEITFVDGNMLRLSQNTRIQGTE
jgi:hypothetical protein